MGLGGTGLGRKRLGGRVGPSEFLPLGIRGRRRRNAYFGLYCVLYLLIEWQVGPVPVGVIRRRRW